MAIDEKGVIDLLFTHSKRLDAIDKRIDSTDAELRKINSQLAEQGKQIEGIHDRFDMIDKRLGSIIDLLNGSEKITSPPSHPIYKRI